MRILFTGVVILISVAGVLGQITLPKLISNGVVFQRDEEVRIWGNASTNENVEIDFAGKKYGTRADAHGSWQVILPSQEAGGPFEMIIRGKNVLTLSDIYFGDVWICSGQSNMELTMERVKEKYASIIATASNPAIRQFTVPDEYDFHQPHHDLAGGQWEAVTPENIFRFSAVAYFFASDLHQGHGIPIGLINSAVGGSPVEAWMSEATIRKFPESLAEYRRFQDDSLIRAIENSDRDRSRKWHETLQKNDPGKHSRENWKASDLDDSGWESMIIPGYWDDNGYKNFNGSVWFRKEVNVPESMTGKPAMLWLGRIVDQDSVFVNGAFAGTTSYQYPPRRYSLNAHMLKPGKNIITVRIINSSGKGGFIPDKLYYLASGKDTLDLRGLWKFKPGAKMPVLNGPTFVRWKPVGLYNKMISPLLKTKIKGVIWYQGESNTDDARAYTRKFSALIADWRNNWGQGDFPFLFVQLANFLEPDSVPGQSNWAELRQAQLNTLSVKHTGMAVTIDIGEWNDIHPLNKADVGKRLALLAERIAYGNKSKVTSGPIPLEAVLRNNKVVIRFDHAPNGLIARPGRNVKHIALSTDGKTFQWADAVIQGSTLVISHNLAGTPRVVRYAWANNPDSANLYNSEGLPATPFEIQVSKP